MILEIVDELTRKYQETQIDVYRFLVAERKRPTALLNSHQAHRLKRVINRRTFSIHRGYIVEHYILSGIRAVYFVECEGMAAFHITSLMLSGDLMHMRPNIR